MERNAGGLPNRDKLGGRSEKMAKVEVGAFQEPRYPSTLGYRGSLLEWDS